jgi:membrane protein
VPVFRFVKALLGGAADFWRKGCSSLAASIAFFSLLSSIPLALLLLQLLGRSVSRSQGTYEFLTRLLHGFFPHVGITGDSLISEIQRISGTPVVRWGVLVAFLLSAMKVFGELDRAINMVWGTSRKRNPFVSTFVSMALLALVQLLLIGAYAATQVLGVLILHPPPVAGLDHLATAAGRFLLRRVLPPVLLVCGATMLYHYVPQDHPPWRRALAGAFVFAPLWEAARHLFAIYVMNSAYYGLMFGSLLAGVLSLLWIYYTAALVLYGAAVVHRLGPSRRH